jgi:ABC-2 type transport system ATP-binding protein
MSSIIEAKNVIKTYAQPVRSTGVLGGLKDLFFRKYKYINAVDDISLTVQKGEFLGYIGPNGAGKSTSIKILTGILQASSGTVRVLGLDPFRNRKEYTRQIGVVFGQRTQLWWDIAVKESFYLLRRIYRLEEADFKTRLDELVTLFDAGALLDTPVRKLSLGERMKCDLVASLLHRPSVLFLDEPTIGLDAVAKDSIRDFLKKLHAMGDTTILLTTHDLQEIEELCKRIVVLDHGKIVYDGNLARIKHLAGFSRQLKLEWDIATNDDDQAIADAVSSYEGVTAVQSISKGLLIDFDPNKVGVPVLLEKLSRIHPLRDLHITEPGIEQVITKLYRNGFSLRS